MTELPEKVKQALQNFMDNVIVDGQTAIVWNNTIRAHIARQQAEIGELARDIINLHKQEKRRMRVSARKDKTMWEMAERIASRAPMIVTKITGGGMMEQRTLTTPVDIVAHFMQRERRESDGHIR